MACPIFGQAIFISNAMITLTFFRIFYQQAEIMSSLLHANICNILSCVYSFVTGTLLTKSQESFWLKVKLVIVIWLDPNKGNEIKLDQVP